MSEERMVFWSVKKLAKEFNLSHINVGRLLNAIGAKSWSKTCGKRIYYWGEND